MNDLVSNPNSAVGMNKLQALNTDLQHYTVFKGNRHQVIQMPFCAAKAEMLAIGMHMVRIQKSF